MKYILQNNHKIPSIQEWKGWEYGPCMCCALVDNRKVTVLTALCWWRWPSTIVDSSIASENKAAVIKGRPMHSPISKSRKVTA